MKFPLRTPALFLSFLLVWSTSSPIKLDSQATKTPPQSENQKSGQSPELKGTPKDEKRAVFVEGPILGRGLPYLSVNAIPYELGKYLYRGSVIEVYFIRSLIPVLESWVPNRCGATTFFLVKADSPEALMALSPLGFSVLFVISAEPWRCQLLEPLWNRISSFYQNLGPGEPPFPAFVETQ